MAALWQQCAGGASLESPDNSSPVSAPGKIQRKNEEKLRTENLGEKMRKVEKRKYWRKSPLNLSPFLPPLCSTPFGRLNSIFLQIIDYLFQRFLFDLFANYIWKKVWIFWAKFMFRGGGCTLLLLSLQGKEFLCVINFLSGLCGVGGFPQAGIRLRYHLMISFNGAV